MYKIKDFLGVLEDFAPLEYSHKMIEKGAYDNSGIIINSDMDVNKVLFSLDLSVEAVLIAVKMGADTIVTHHPAIYAPLKNLSVENDSKAVLLAAQNNLNVISMHLNLDVASEGIDFCLAQAFGGEEQTILDVIDCGVGYGRVFEVNQTLEDVVEKAKKTFKTDKILTYGSGKIGTLATFCGSGAHDALIAVQNDDCKIDAIVTSDIAHHEIKELIEKNIKIIILPHYAAEEYGFNKFYLSVSDVTKGLIEVYYFDDKRFK